MDYLQWKTQMRSEYFSRNVLAGNINRWKNITADGLFRKNGTTTIWIWKHRNNLMVNNCSKRNSNWEIDDWMVRTEVKISIYHKYHHIKTKYHHKMTMFHHIITLYQKYHNIMTMYHHVCYFIIVFCWVIFYSVVW
jgi:hypothetical protein